MRAGQKQTAQPIATATVNQNADTRPALKEDPVTWIDSPCHLAFVPFFLRIPDPVVAGVPEETLRRRQNQNTHHKLSTPASSLPCDQANNQPPRTIPTQELPKESHVPCDTPERSVKSATFDVDPTRSFQETSHNVPPRSFSSAAATVPQRSGGECRIVTELSQSGRNSTISFPGIGMIERLTNHPHFNPRHFASLAQSDHAEGGWRCPWTHCINPRSTPSCAASGRATDSGDLGFRNLPRVSSARHRRSCRHLPDQWRGNAGKL